MDTKQTKKARLSFSGTKEQMLRYFSAIDTIEKYEEVLTIDKPVTQQMIERMQQGKLVQRAEIIRMRLAHA
jgi:hypothetical protein